MTGGACFWHSALGGAVTVTWEHREAEHGTTISTMTPVGFPLSRYSHRAPREGRSLSTAALTASLRRGALAASLRSGTLTTSLRRGALATLLRSGAIAAPLRIGTLTTIAEERGTRSISEERRGGKGRKGRGRCDCATVRLCEQL
jgi:hypothetical protein